MNKEKIKSSYNLAHIIAQLVGLWLFVVLWWGLMVLAPLQIHNQILCKDLPYICAGIMIFFLIGFRWKGKVSFQVKKKSWIIPLVFVFILDGVLIFYFRNITLSFIVTTASLVLIGQIIDHNALIHLGSLLFVSSLGLGITRLSMNLFRGRTETGSRFFAHQISFLLNLFGKDTDVVANTLFFQGKKITCDLIKMGFFPWLAFVLSFLAFILIAKGTRRKKVWVSLGALFIHYVYLLGRFSCISVMIPNSMFAGLDTFNLFYWRLLILSFVLLLPVWFVILYESQCLEYPHQMYRLPHIALKRSDVWLLSMITISVVLGTVCFLFHGFTQQRNIHCIIDEIHSDWESTLIDFNPNIMGILAENSYHSFLDYLRHFYPITVMTNKPIINSGLQGVALFNTPVITRADLHNLKTKYANTQPVLIVKCITTPFSPEEIELLKDFVFEGGSVLLIGDHTDVYFMNKNLNELSKHFGIRFKQDSVYFIDGGWVITDYPNYRMHPATHYLEKFIWATGDSLHITHPAFPLIYSSPVCFADEVNYFYDNFFGNTKIDAAEVFGSFCIMAGSRYGKGKIIAFTDSTCFNNYLMFSVGRRELIAGVLKWLGNKETINPLPLLTVLSFCFLGFVILKRRTDPNTLLYLCSIGVSMGWIMGYGVSLSLNPVFYPQPKPIRPLPREVIIDASHKPLHAMSFGNSEFFLAPTSYDNLLYTIGRIDIFSRIFYEGLITKEDLNSASCLIIASPTKKYCKKERNDIKLYIKEGGTLLLIEGANPDSSINQIAHLFDIHFRLDPYRHTVKKIKERLITNKRDNLQINPAWVDGGDIIFEFNHMPIIRCKREGKGLIIAIGDDGLFMKGNFSVFGKELVTLQRTIINALVSKDAIFLKSMNWDYVEGIL
ncbi:MAG: hypothetical protein ACMUIP_07675 [bacterium]